MAKSRPSTSIPDDIDLLNIHRYPESVPASMLAYVRNSRACQKRLDELLKNMQMKRNIRGNIDELLPKNPDKEQEYEPAPRSDEAEPESSGLKRLLRRVLNK